MWIYDNVNLLQRIRYEREGMSHMYTYMYYVYLSIHFTLRLTTDLDQHANMLNITSRLAVNIRYVPDWEFDWSDTSPQRSRESLTISDFMLSESDGKGCTYEPSAT